MNPIKIHIKGCILLLSMLYYWRFFKIKLKRFFKRQKNERDKNFFSLIL